MFIAGVDEAGRGPVIGPMVMAIVSISKEDEFQLQAFGVKDSKELTPKQREQLFDVIQEVSKNEVIIVPAGEIDNAVLSEETNLNWLEADYAAKLINKLKPDKVFLDCPSTNLEAFKRYMEKRINYKAELIVAHKADQLYPAVSAASVLAKVTRDREIEKIKKKLNVDFGSGYSSDPKTRDFLEQNWDNKEYQKYYRKSWATWRACKALGGQKRLGEF